MSVKTLTWAWMQNVPPATKIVLMALADHADDGGICWPGIKGVAVKCGMHCRSVQRHISRLTSLGLIESVQRLRPDGSRTSNLFVLKTGVGGVNIDTGVVTIPSPPPDNNATTPTTPASPPPDTSVTPRTVIEPSFEPSLLTDSIPSFLLELRRIPAWKKVPVSAEIPLLAFLENHGITPHAALKAATALAGKWDGRKYKDPVATFKNWALREIDRTGGGFDGAFESGPEATKAAKRAYERRTGIQTPDE